MKLAIMQPYFMPYIGYWQLMTAVDNYVIFDDVNFINRGWINRNKILVNGHEHLFSIALHEASQNKLIKDIEIADNFQKLRKTIELNYKKAPFFEDVMDLLDEIFCFNDKNLARFIGNSFEVVSKYIDISCNFIFSSGIEKNKDLKASKKILDICKCLNASEYINAIGGQELYSKEEFAENDITLKFIKIDETISYKQNEEEFIPNLSIIDVLMYNGKERTKALLNRYTLI